MSTESERRKQIIAQGQTDTARWLDPAQLEQAWNQRARLAADFIPSGAAVLDLGCGAMALEQFLPPACTYLPCDLVARDQRTLVCDFNAGNFPVAESATHITVLGVLEYIYDLPTFLHRLRVYARPVVLSYNPTDLTGSIDRPALGWVNHLGFMELERALRAAGLFVISGLQIDHGQVLLHLSPEERPVSPSCKVLVLSALSGPNFGDRLGYHLINEVLPAHATVNHAWMNFAKGCRIEGVPAGDIDLLVLGIGNSLSNEMLTDELLQLLARSKQAIGIFGTQYREQIDAARLAAVLDRLAIWYARYDEDIQYHGKGRLNVVHLGDWLISAFPMSRGENPTVLNTGAEMWHDLPLDRTIQRIQAHRQVFGTRMHPLLCALTSAEQVAYHEQRNEKTGLVSGKFRSLLLDIFGKAFPENEFFTVDRDAVAAYKLKVRQGMMELRKALQDLV
jgi:hypothetical protein